MCGVSAEARVNATGLRASRRGRRRRDCGQPAPSGGLVVGPQDLGDRLAVPVLLVAPARQEGRDLGVAVGPGGEEVAQVARGVSLHVVHVAEAAQGGGVERMPAEGLEVDVVHLRGGPSAGSGSRCRWSRLLFDTRPPAGCVGSGVPGSQVPGARVRPGGRRPGSGLPSGRGPPRHPGRRAAPKNLTTCSSSRRPATPP